MEQPGQNKVAPLSLDQLNVTWSDGDIQQRGYHLMAHTEMESRRWIPTLPRQSFPRE